LISGGGEISRRSDGVPYRKVVRELKLLERAIIEKHLADMLTELEHHVGSRIDVIDDLKGFGVHQGDHSCAGCRGEKRCEEQKNACSQPSPREDGEQKTCLDVFSGHRIRISFLAKSGNAL